MELKGSDTLIETRLSSSFIIEKGLLSGALTTVTTVFAFYDGVGKKIRAAA